MNTRRSLYSSDQIDLMWNSVSYNSCRKWAFFSHFTQRWHHPAEDFTRASLERFISDNRVTDVHVKATNDRGGGREWVIDVDFAEHDHERLLLRMDVAQRAFQNFFGENVQRIMYSGNRGVHVWLKISAFSIYATRETRLRYYKAFKLIGRVECDNIRPGSFLHALDRAIDEPALRQRIDALFPTICSDRAALLTDLFPPVDEAVFCNLNQIRAPFSYNYKGRKFSRQLA